MVGKCISVNAIYRLSTYQVRYNWQYSIAKGGSGWARAHPTHINYLSKSLVCPVTGIKRSIYSNKTVKHFIKTLSSSIMPTQLNQTGYATDNFACTFKSK